MIVAATFLFHDYEPSIIYFDSKELDSNDYIDTQILNSLKKRVRKY